MIRLSGRLRSALIIGGQGIRARKLRTLLSMVSLFLGVLAVVVVQAGAETAKAALLSNLELTDGKDGTVRMYVPGEAVPVALETLRGRPDAVAAVTTNAIIGEPRVRPVNVGAAPFDQPGSEEYGPQGQTVVCDSRGCHGVDEPGDPAAPAGAAIELMLTALTGDIRPFRPFRQEAGGWLDFSSRPSMSPRIVLNTAAAKGFAMHRVPAEMRVQGAPVNATPRIVGVVDDGSPQPGAYVRVDELFTWMPRTDKTNQLYANGASLTLAAAGTDTERILRARLVASGVAAANFPAEVVNSKKAIATELALMRWVFLGMAALVLLIGVAGILNVGLATVGERVEEFALRRAVGTPRSLLAAIVLAETLLTGLFTAAAAIGVAVAALELGVKTFAPPDPLLQNLTFPWQAAVAGVIAGLVAGLLGGLIPALRASRIPIATVMRA